MVKGANEKPSRFGFDGTGRPALLTDRCFWLCGEVAGNFPPPKLPFSLFPFTSGRPANVAVKITVDQLTKSVLLLLKEFKHRDEA